MISKIISKLKEQQDIVAKQSVEQPPSHDAVNLQYLYGQRIGYYAGLQKALDLIDGILRDQDKKDSQL